MTERHEKPGVKRRRLSSQRWRKRFADEVCLTSTPHSTLYTTCYSALLGQEKSAASDEDPRSRSLTEPRHYCILFIFFAMHLIENCG